MAQGRSTKIISMVKWIRTSRLSIKHSLSLWWRGEGKPLFPLPPSTLNAGTIDPNNGVNRSRRVQWRHSRSDREIGWGCPQTNPALRIASYPPPKQTKTLETDISGMCSSNPNSKWHARLGRNASLSGGPFSLLCILPHTRTLTALHSPPH